MFGVVLIYAVFILYLSILSEDLSLSSSYNSPQKDAIEFSSDAPVVKKTKKSKKKQKEAQDMGFDNPVYNLKPNGTGEGTDSMVSVSLDEEEAGLPGYVEHDGTGNYVCFLKFCNA